MEYDSRFSLLWLGGIDLSMDMITLAHCFRNSFSDFSITIAYVLPIMAINMLSSRMGMRIWKRTKMVFAIA